MTKFKLDILKFDDIASKIKALAHPMRVAIVSLLESETKLNVTEISHKIKIAQTTTSHHLNILKNKGLLISKREGKETFYSLKSESLAKIIECIMKCTG
ncbi:MAG: helix-turn-helix transcriptional regulator [Bacteroidetes bacterium]|nr:helix-turn-helix transcriptional regulator [Bacteroidota bacterium]